MDRHLKLLTFFPFLQNGLPPQIVSTVKGTSWMMPPTPCQHQDLTSVPNLYLPHWRITQSSPSNHIWLPPTACRPVPSLISLKIHSGPPPVSHHSHLPGDGKFRGECRAHVGPSHCHTPIRRTEKCG